MALSAGDLNTDLPRDSSTGNLVQRFESACRRFQAVRACIEGVISETSQTLTDLRVSPRDSPTGELVQLVRRSFRYFAVAAWDQVQINSQLEICCKYIEHNKAFLETEFSEPISQFLWEVCGFDELWIFESLASDYLEMDLLDFRATTCRLLFFDPFRKTVQSPFLSPVFRGYGTAPGAVEQGQKAEVRDPTATARKSAKQTSYPDHEFRPRLDWDPEVYEVIREYCRECKSAGIKVPTMADIYHCARIDKGDFSRLLNGGRLTKNGKLSENFRRLCRICQIEKPHLESRKPEQ